MLAEAARAPPNRAVPARISRPLRKGSWLAYSSVLTFHFDPPPAYLLASALRKIIRGRISGRHSLFGLDIGGTPGSEDWG